MDRILIKDLRCRCIIGVDPHERAEKQDVVIDVAIYADLRPAATSDSLEDATDYRAIAERILSEVEKSRYHLVEALAERVAGICLEHPGVQWAQVTVEKPAALPSARGVAVEITRERT